MKSSDYENVLIVKHLEGTLDEAEKADFEALCAASTGFQREAEMMKLVIRTMVEFDRNERKIAIRVYCYQNYYQTLYP